MLRSAPLQDAACGRSSGQGARLESMMPPETHSASEYSALLRTDFASFAQHRFHELNPRTLFAASWCRQGQRYIDERTMEQRSTVHPMQRP